LELKIFQKLKHKTSYPFRKRFEPKFKNLM